MKRIITTIALMLALTISVTAQHKIYGNLEVYGTIKGQGLSAKSSADTLVMFDQADSLFYKVAVSDLNVSSESAGSTPFLAIDDGSGGTIVNDTSDHIYFTGDPSTFNYASPSDNFIYFRPREGTIMIYPEAASATAGGSIVLNDFAVRSSGDRVYFGRDSESNDSRASYILLKRDNSEVFSVDTVGNTSVKGMLRLQDSWKSTVTPQLGDMYFDNSDSTLRIYTGDQFETVNTTP